MALPNLNIDVSQLIMAAIGFIVWLSRLEAKVKRLERDSNGIGRKVGGLENEIRKDLKSVELSLARVEVKLGIQKEQ